MHLLDMYTREKTNKIHLDKMRRDGRHRDSLRGMNSTRELIISNRMRLMLIFVTLILLLGASLIPSIGRF